MMEKIMRIISSVLIPLGAFAMYWLSIHFGDDSYSGTDLLWAVLVTIILIVAWYLFFPLRKKVERFSIAWLLGVNFGIGLTFIGLISSHMMGTTGGSICGFTAFGVPFSLLCCARDTNGIKYHSSRA